MTDPVRGPERVVFATAGHVDHGKTSLILALTGTDTDRLPDEKRRGISIELGFAELPEAGISFIDVPGHRKLVHAMIAGVGGVDALLLVVAADDGVMPQTREHLWISALLGIRRVVVALTKADVVDAETLELAEADVRTTLENLGFEPFALIPTSVVSRRGLPELARALEALAKTVPPRAESRRLWLPIDRVFTIKGAGTVVTGTLVRGTLELGSALYVAGPKQVHESACRGLEIHGHAVERARAPTRVAVNLAKLDTQLVARGDVVTLDGALPVARRIDVSLRILPGAERELENGSPVIVYVGTTRRIARFTRLGETLAHLALDEPLPCQGGVGVVLRGFRSSREHGAVLAGGLVLDAAAPGLPRKRDAAAWQLRAETLDAVARDDWAAALGGLLAQAAPRAISGPDIERRFGLEPGDVARWLAGKKRKGPADALSLPGGESFTTAASLTNLIEDVKKRVARHHARHPHEPGISLETLRVELATRSGRNVAELGLERAAKAGQLQIEQGVVCLPEFALDAGPAAQRAAESVLGLLDQAGLEGLGESVLLAKLGGERPEAVKSALVRLGNATRARRLGGIWFAERHLDELRQKVRAHLSTRPSMSVPEFKELAGVSRKQAIPLLEQLDREGTTRRKGDERVLGAGEKA